MADDIQVSQTTPGGNGFSVDLKQRSLGITGPIVVPVLCLILIGVIGWIRSADLKEGMAAIHTTMRGLYARQDVIKDELSQQNVALIAQTKELVVAVQSQTHELITTTHGHTTHIMTALQEQNDLLREQTAQLRQWFSTYMYNVSHPEAPLPLDLPPPPSR